MFARRKRRIMCFWIRRKERVGCSGVESWRNFSVAAYLLTQWRVVCVTEYLPSELIIRSFFAFVEFE